MGRKRIKDRLFKRITDRIRSEEKLLTLRRRTILFSLASGVSTVAFVGFCFLLQSALVQSELLRALSLVFSDPEAVLMNWRDFGLLVLESTPAVSLAGVFAVLFLLILSAGYAVRYFAKMISLVRQTRMHSHEY